MIKDSPEPNDVREALLDRIKALKPALKERARRCEEERRVCLDTVADLKAAGLHLVGVPPRFGGLDLEVDTGFAAAVEVGRYCGSSAWMTSQWPIHNFFIGTFSEQAQQEIWGVDPHQLSSTASAVKQSTIAEVEGGYRISGLWGLSSGIDHAEWLILLNTGDPTGEVSLALIPKADFEIIDDWHVMGLRGTGSKSVRIDNAFVPKHRILSRMEFTVAGKGVAEAAGKVLYHAPKFVIYPWTLAAPLIGMVKGMLDEVEAQLPRRKNAMSGKAQSEADTFRLRFAQASVMVDTAELILREAMKEVLSQASTGTPMPPSEVVRLNRNRAYAVQICSQAAELLFDCSGGGALYQDNPIQRLYRDAKAASRHVALNIEEAMIPYAADRFGQTIAAPYEKNMPKAPDVAVETGHSIRPGRTK